MNVGAQTKVPAAKFDQNGHPDPEFRAIILQELD